MSKPTKARGRPQFSKAELKAYEARRAEEIRRVPAGSAAADTAAGGTASVRRTYALSRDEEYAIIRGDLRRLLLILAVLALVLLVATVIFR